MVAYHPFLTLIAAFQSSSLVTNLRKSSILKKALCSPATKYRHESEVVPEISSCCRRIYLTRFAFVLHSSPSQPDEQRRTGIPDTDKEGELDFLRNELSHLESLEEILSELEEYDFGDEDAGEADDAFMVWDEESLEELLGNLPDDEEKEVFTSHARSIEKRKYTTNDFRESAALGLEKALLQGVVPVSAGVGNECMPGDFGFDPLGLAKLDLFLPAQNFLLNLLPGGESGVTTGKGGEPRRPNALVLRDYREAEIRHGRLAMLAAVIWPLQEMLDRFILPEDQFGPLIYGPVTLPYFPLAMTAIMLLLGYLDIYSKAIKDMDQIGEAFIPGDCFWDPLQILLGAPDRMKRNMQERELFNGRAAMLAVSAYILEEALTHNALIEIENNALLLEPAYQVPFIQRWLDAQFSISDPESAFMTPADLGSLDTLLQPILSAYIIPNH